jgi:hypothetical protein
MDMSRDPGLAAAGRKISTIVIVAIAFVTAKSAFFRV